MQQPLNLQRLLPGPEVGEIDALGPGVFLELCDQSSVLDPVDQQGLGQLDHGGGFVASAERGEMGRAGRRSQFADQSRALIHRRRGRARNRVVLVFAVGHGLLRSPLALSPPNAPA